MNADSVLLQNEAAIRNAAFYGVIIVVALWEVALPGRSLAYSFRVRWLSNIGLALINFVLLRWIVPFAGMTVAFFAQEQGWGLMALVAAPDWLLIVAGVLALDLTSYVGHRVFHAWRPMWRLHLVHHADLDADFTTGYRHHPVELLVAGPIHMAGVLVFGAPPEAVLLFGVVGSIFSVWTHGNIAAFGPAAESVLRSLFITPSVHCVHHSAVKSETDSNYGLIFSIWDRLFGTYCARPAAGYQHMTIGLEYFREPADLYLHRILAMPFLTPGDASPARESEAIPKGIDRDGRRIGAGD